MARTIFLGTGEFAVAIGRALAVHPSIDLAAVVTAPPRPGSRGRQNEPPVAVWAADHGVPMLRPEHLRAPDSFTLLADLRPELLVLADYGQIVPQSILDLPRHGALNVHPSLLPRHRGATPIPAAILAGDDETGVTLMLMDAGLDSGPIIGQSRMRLEGGETGPQLEAALAKDGAALLKGMLSRWLTGEIQSRPQAEEGITLTRPLRREDGRLDPSRSAEQLERQVRAYQPWPGTFFESPDGRVTIWRSRVAPGSGQAGTILAGPAQSPLIATSDGLLELLEVQRAGGRRMSGVELLRGRPGLVGQSVA